MIRAALAAVAAAAALVAVVAVADGTAAAAGTSNQPAPIPNPTSFFDTFDNGRLDGWLPRNFGTVDGPARWQVPHGQLVQSSNVYGGSTAASALDKPGAMLVAGDPQWTNYDFTVQARTADNDDFGIVFRYQGPNDFYRFSMDSERHYRRLVKRVQGRYQLLAQSPVGYTPNSTYTLRVVAVWSRLQVYVNGAALFDVRDTSLGSGRLGVYTWGCPTTFDDVSAQVEDDDYFTLAVLPDTQYEVRDDPTTLSAQTTWLVQHRADLHLAAVLHEGDVVDKMRSTTQWDRAAQYLGYLGGKVPYAIAAGNHDVLDFTGETPYPVYSAPFDAFIARLPDSTVSGRFRTDSDLNTYQLLDAGGVHLLILDLQFGARDDVLQWAGKVADRYPDRHAVLLTHDYLGSNSQVRGPDVVGGNSALPSAYNVSLNDPVDIWAKLVKTHPNVQFVLNGHVIDPTGPTEPWSVGRLVSANDAGRPVYQMLANYQTFAGGRGFLRLLRFYPATGRLAVTTYSPAENSYLTDDDDQFGYDGVDLGAWPPAA